ncbi:hypothetical protein [Nocardioides aurantiacus]|uniref:hypothetical protein n=1 Tax=Nocardioides aurantiacus TaxID=86796 RepID=UPI00403EF9C7
MATPQDQPGPRPTHPDEEVGPHDDSRRPVAGGSAEDGPSGESDVVPGEPGVDPRTPPERLRPEIEPD